MKVTHYLNEFITPCSSDGVTAGHDLRADIIAQSVHISRPCPDVQKSKLLIFVVSRRGRRHFSAPLSPATGFDQLRGRRPSVVARVWVDQCSFLVITIPDNLSLLFRQTPAIIFRANLVRLAIDIRANKTKLHRPVAGRVNAHRRKSALQTRLKRAKTSADIVARCGHGAVSLTLPVRIIFPTDFAHNFLADFARSASGNTVA